MMVSQPVACPKATLCSAERRNSGAHESELSYFNAASVHKQRSEVFEFEWLEICAMVRNVCVRVSVCV